MAQLRKPGKDAEELDLKDVIASLEPAFRLKGGVLKFKEKRVDEDGYAHVKYLQTKNGLDVVGGTLTVHIDNKGKVFAALGGARDDEAAAETPTIDEAQARAAALSEYGGTVKATGCRLVYDLTTWKQDLVLTWEARVAGVDASGKRVSEMVYVDATTGAIVDKVSNQFDMVRASWKVAESATAYPGKETNSPPPGWFPLLQYRTEGTWHPSASYYSLNLPNIVEYADTNWLRMYETYNYFANVHGRHSYDGNPNTPIDSVVNGMGYQNNAMFTTEPYLNRDTNQPVIGAHFEFGLGESGGTPFGSSRMVVTHEFAHAVSWKTSNLRYAFESGGLNESFSDIMGAAEYSYYAGGVSSSTWNCGAEVPNSRTMNNPRSDVYSWYSNYAGCNFYDHDWYPEWDALRQRDIPVYESNRWVSSLWKEDNGWVHHTSGISNLAFYLLSQGGTHPRQKSSVVVPALGITNAARVFYKAFTTYLTENSQFVDARIATVLAASQLGLDATFVDKAWEAVGVPTPADNYFPVNLSTRAYVETGDRILIAGFTLGGGGSAKRLLVRGVGPTLGSVGVPNAMSNPTMTIFSGSSVIASNDNWGQASNSGEIANTAGAVGAFALPAGSLDSAVVQSFSSGSYTAQVSPLGSVGEAMVEVYDTDFGNSNHLVNLSSRAYVSPSHPMIGGIVVNGSGPIKKRLLVRAVGPGLSALGVTGIANPKLTVFKGANVIYENDDWISVDGALAASAQNVGAFALSEGSKDAAMLVYLDPGAYTVQVTSSGGSSGLALLEVYEVNKLTR